MFHLENRKISFCFHFDFDDVDDIETSNNMFDLTQFD